MGPLVTPQGGSAACSVYDTLFNLFIYALLLTTVFFHICLNMKNGFQYARSFFWSAHFSRKCARLLQWVVFFRRVRSTFLFICSTTSNLNNFESQKRVQNEKNKQNRRPEPRNHTKDPPPPIAPLFFGTMRLLKLFGLHQRVPPSFFSTFCNTMDVKKIPKGPPFTFFGTVALFKNLISKFFSDNFFKSSKGSPSIFLYFATSWSFTKPEGSPFHNFEP